MRSILVPVQCMILLSSIIFSSTPAYADDVIYKCENNGKIVYQDTNCSSTDKTFKININSYKKTDSNTSGVRPLEKELFLLLKKKQEIIKNITIN